MVANNYASGAHATGRYAARNMIQYINSLSEVHPLDRLQIETEKKRVYASVRRTDGIGWKEFKNGCCRVMQDHCTEYKTDKLLRQGIQWFESIRESEMPMLRARNPHELGKVLECYAQLECSEMTLYASLARKAGTKVFDFKRTDYPEYDPPEYDVFITVSCDENGNYITDKLPLDYYLQAPCESDFKSNYEKYASLEVRRKL
jgi:succinate dehydrogenase/fumarate reductase flavoprotein subunit